MRYLAFLIALTGFAIAALMLAMRDPWAPTPFILFGALSAIGVWDMMQTRHSLRRNYPIIAHLRFLLEAIRPELRQYFFESDTDGAPFNRSERALVYQRAKNQLQTRPFGTELDVYAKGFEWISHSLAPIEQERRAFRIRVGGPQCAQPYDMSLFNISAMSFGSLSGAAIRALNKGAKMGGFAQDTGEGGFSVHHRVFGGDIIWEVASGYFGCRDAEGRFSPERFAATAADPQIKMIEIKLSQGAKPGHGGVLPGAKVSPEIAAARGVPIGRDCISPARHSAFSTPVEMMRFIAQLSELSGGKPVGFKLCIGLRTEFMALCKAMLKTGITPDFMVIDGKEGGTGAAPLEFCDHVGMPLREGLAFAQNCLVGAGLRDRVKLAAAGRIITAFDMARAIALGADWCNAGRGFMFAVGCVQSMTCHTDQCPTGVATQNPTRQRALVVETKAERVARFHAATLSALAELCAAAGLAHPQQITPSMIMHRAASGEVMSFEELYPTLASGELIAGARDPNYANAWAMAQAESFAPLPRPTAVAA